MDYTAITIIYNPNSTGPSKSLAQKLQTQLHTAMPQQKVELVATEHAGHAELLAYEAAQASKRPLIISSSGDGGYNEVINGALRAQQAGAEPTVGLLPGGNANDHFQNLHDGKQLVDHIAHSKPAKLDVLRISSTSADKPFERYAHSYIGFGLTPAVGKELNKANLNFFAEMLIVARALFALKPVGLLIGSKSRPYDSVIFSNIDVMAKYLRVSTPSSVTDGKFEVTIFQNHNRLRLLWTLLKASVMGVEEDMQVSKFDLRTISETLVQVDGEIFTLDAKSTVNITIGHRLLATLI